MSESMDEVKIEEWVVALIGGGMQYLGRVAPDVERGWTVTSYLQALRDGRLERALRLDVAFEFATPLQQTPQGTKRTVVLLPIGIASRPVPIYVRPATIYACAEMTEADQKGYRDVVLQGYEMLRGTMSTRDVAPPRPVLAS